MLLHSLVKFIRGTTSELPGGQCKLFVRFLLCMAVSAEEACLQPDAKQM